MTKKVPSSQYFNNKTAGGKDHWFDWCNQDKRDCNWGHCELVQDRRDMHRFINILIVVFICFVLLKISGILI